MESIPGGSAVIYLANNIIRVDPASKLTDDKEFGINGFLTEITMVKTRTNRAGVKFNLVFNQVKGFLNVLSNYIMFKSEKRIGGAGRAFYLDNAPTEKFSQKDFIKKMKESKKLRIAYKEILAEFLESVLNGGDRTDDEDDVEELLEDNIVDEDDDEDEDEVPMRSKKKRRPVVVEDDDEDEEDDEEESEDDEDEEEEEEPPRRVKRRRR